MHPIFLLLWLAISLLRVAPLEGDTGHVQGIAVDEGRLFLTSVDREARKGRLLEFDAETGKQLRAVELQTGEMYHPGGIDVDDEAVWVPVAEYRPESRSVIQRRLKSSLELAGSFEVADHIGALAVLPEGLLLANWDARKFYLYSRDGKLIWTKPNPNPTRYQDMKRRYGAIVASGLRGRGAAAQAVVEWLDPETLRPLENQVLGRSDRGVPLTSEGMDYRDGRLYLVPENAPSRLFVFKLED